MLVIVSWVSFWLDQSAVPARVSLGNVSIEISSSFYPSTTTFNYFICAILTDFKISLHFLSFYYSFIFYSS